MYDLIKASIWNAYKSVSKKSNSHWLADLVMGLTSQEEQIQEALKHPYIYFSFFPLFNYFYLLFLALIFIILFVFDGD